MPLTALLEWVEGDSCLAVKRNGNTENLFSTFVPIWPEGTRPVRASDGRRGIDVPKVGLIYEGALFETVGSEIPTIREAPKTCAVHDGFFVVEPWGMKRLHS